MNKQSAPLQTGSHVGDLQINGVLGEGAFAITYLVSDPAIGTTFALKEYLPSHSVVRNKDGSVTIRDATLQPAFAAGLELFLAEARLLAALDHPNIVKVLRYFEANATAYILMPWYPGQPLDQRLKSAGVFTPEQAKALLVPLMDGLEYLHHQGVIHQDIKPANIYLREDGDPILLDFGVAAAGNDGTLTATKFGSEGYAALEQCTTGDRIGPWTDIYALAATLHRCVTGFIPPTATARQAALKTASDDLLKPLKQRLSAGYYGGLTDAIETGLKLASADRPRDVAQWKKAFKSLDWRHSVTTEEHTTAYPKEGREWLPLVLLGIFVLAVLAIGIFLFTDEITELTGESTGTPIEQVETTAVATRQLPQPVTTQETSRWQAALKTDTTLAYRRFMADYPDSIYLSQAQMQLDILDEKSWQDLSAEDSVAAYEDYLGFFPDGIHQQEAMTRIDAIKQAEARVERARLERERLEKLAWENAGNTATIEALKQYITDWPGGLHIDTARHLLRDLIDQANDEKAFASAKKLHHKNAYQAYIDAFPRGVHVGTALEQMDELTLRPGKTFRDCPGCPLLKVIPAGAYWQGSEDDSALALSMEKPRRMIAIDAPFAVSIHEITMAEWDRCFESESCSNQPGDNAWGRANRPVIMVSWTDAEQYVHWLSATTGQSYRLPSESEWEYFARAGEETDWMGGDVAGLCEFANVAGSETGFAWQHTQCGDDRVLGTAPVGSYKANAFGLYDVIGNVSEWTADCMNLSYLDAPVDGSAWGRGMCSSHMTRGGSWITGSQQIRLPARFNLNNGDRNDFTGFRVVRAIVE